MVRSGGGPETIQICVTKMNASVSEIRWTFEVQSQAAAESTDKKIDDSVGEVWSEAVSSLVNQVRNIEEIWTLFDGQIREAVRRALENQEKVTSKPTVKKTADNGIFFTGLNAI